MMDACSFIATRAQAGIWLSPGSAGLTTKGGSGVLGSGMFWGSCLGVEFRQIEAFFRQVAELLEPDI